MIIEKTIEYKKRLVITDKSLGDLEALLFEFCDKISYKARTKGKASIKFSSREELLNYDNFKDGKIVNLDVWCRSSKGNNSINIEFAPTARLHKESARCTYEFENVEDEIVFAKKMNTFFEKATEAQGSFLMCELITGLSILALTTGSVIWLSKNAMKQYIALPISLFLYFALFAYFVPSKYLWEKVFPPAVFPWGEEAKHYEKIRYVRQNLFWALLIPVVISIVLGAVHL